MFSKLKHDSKDKPLDNEELYFEYKSSDGTIRKYRIISERDENKIIQKGIKMLKRQSREEIEKGEDDNTLRKDDK
ncbi:hypothetical protein Mia14_0311 [Candidatus Mancarchaeum acidiphilum]|uniref:Uncharacterized protein n=1 Tax=Candidatus Mancarchaeum acidiphilum TaxID=1920749 RepID=A0A218NME1_9ARCH|nr:hypothetical protein [Candidatus Mancarchaeum acidiphilum]ASI13638.1 hypothetical protein Mia14_0311 [Candidatus Mancarchaeum acidiphilum]